MVNKIATDTRPDLRLTTWLVTAYVVVVLGTLAVLSVLSAAGLPGATGPAWTHVVVVAVFAVLLPLRLRAARHGRPGALRAVRVIAGVLLVVNLVEGLALALFPTWMRVEMVVVALLMALVVVATLRTPR